MCSAHRDFACAPHTKKTGEIGLIKLLGSEKLRGGVRIELKAGSRALADYNDKYSNAFKISSMLCVKQNEIADATQKLQEQISNLKFELTGIKKQILLSKVDNFNPENEVTCLFEDGLDIKTLQSFADALYKKAGGIRAVLSGEDNSFSFAICGDEAELNDLFSKFKEAFQVRGGGRNGMVQGTVIANKSDIEEFFSI